VLGQRWSLGIDAFQCAANHGHRGGAVHHLRGIRAGLLLVAGFMTVAWRYGRLYCGWLCPHFSWWNCSTTCCTAPAASSACGTSRPDAARQRSRSALVAAFGLSCAGFWLSVGDHAADLPAAAGQIWGNLLQGTLTPNQARFLLIGTWSSRSSSPGAPPVLPLRLRRGLVPEPGLDGQPQGHGDGLRPRARARLPQLRHRRAQGGAACDHACPMRLTPRNIKRLMFACVQCGSASPSAKARRARSSAAPLLEWKVGVDAVRETLRQRRG
jgi:ferredoxin-type protein NapH